jgi:hypothetical protein
MTTNDEGEAAYGLGDDRDGARWKMVRDLWSLVSKAELQVEYSSSGLAIGTEIISRCDSLRYGDLIVRMDQNSGSG